MTTDEFIEHAYIAILRMKADVGTHRLLAIVTIVCTLLSVAIGVVNSINIHRIERHDGIISRYPSGASHAGPEVARAES